MVGHQNGSFPEIGWHIPGEMGGIWDHPIKLFDGFQAEITTSGHSIALDDASEFTNFPVASRQVFNFSEEQIKSFKDLNNEVVLSIDHDLYNHKTIISKDTKVALIKDFI